VEEVRTAAAMLTANAALLSAQYREFFGASSRFHSAEQFHPSFLVPPPHPTPAAMRRWSTCAMCAAKEVDSKVAFRKCGTCKTHLYCSQACQDAHAPAHARVCAASLETLRASPAVRPSLLISTAPPTCMVGMYSPTFNFQGAVPMETDFEKTLVKAVAPLNVHGSATFLVKVQPPGDGEGGRGPCGFVGRTEWSASVGEAKPWACMVYDEPRSLPHVYLPLDTPGVEALLWLIKRGGVRVASGQYKGFCEAVREGACLRIYTDRLGPPQKW
jgi:hypothetical protein